MGRIVKVKQNLHDVREGRNTLTDMIASSSMMMGKNKTREREES